MSFPDKIPPNPVVELSRTSYESFFPPLESLVLLTANDREPEILNFYLEKLHR